MIHSREPMGLIALVEPPPPPPWWRHALTETAFTVRYALLPLALYLLGLVFVFRWALKGAP